jgi:hypothetical protein
MKMRVVPAALSLAFAAACMAPSQPAGTGTVTPAIQVDVGREFEIAVGQDARVQGSNIVIRFRGVTNDSRCPSDVQCVWAGNAVVNLDLSGEGLSGASLNTTLEPKSVRYGGYAIGLVGLKPVPKSGTAIPALEYVATLRVSAT